MKIKDFSFSIFLFAFLACTLPQTFAQPASEIEIIFDASRSMLEPAGPMSKLDAAKQALAMVAGEIQPGARVGLRAFGLTPVRGNVRESCKDSQLVIPIGPYRKDEMISRVMAFQANGQTPIGYSLELAANDFTPGNQVKKTIILISDGAESCDYDPIGVIQKLKAQGIDVVIHAIGFDVDPAAAAQLRELSRMTGGTYTDAKNPGELNQALTQVAEQAELLIAPEKKVGGNILSAASGTRIISSSTAEFAKLIDGKEDQTDVIYKGQEVVFSFGGGQPVLLEKFAVPIFKQASHNPKTLELFGSAESSESGFFPIRTVEVQNKVFFGNVYQEFPVDPPVAIRFLKAVVGPAQNGDPNSYHTEWAAYGKFLSEEELAQRVQDSEKQEKNLLARVHGGQLIAAANMEFQNLIDGTEASPGEAASIHPPAEGIFGFKDGKTAVIRKITVPVFEASPYNVKTLEVEVSAASPTSGFTPAGKFEVTNMVFAANPYQEFEFERPVRAKYLKIRIVDTQGGHYSKIPEIRAYGTLE